MTRAKLNRVTILGMGLLISLAFSSPVSASAVEKKDGRSAFDLVVRFSPFIFNNKMEIKLRIIPNQPFTGGTTDKEGTFFFNIGGMLLPKKSGKYRLVLSYASGTNARNQGIGTTVPELEVGKESATVCSIDGLVRDCISVTLSAAKESK
jgi:hypothetical protein